MRASPRLPWRTLLLALLLVAAGCTTGLAPQPPPATSTSAAAAQPPTTMRGPAGVKLSGAFRLPPGYSAGLVTSQGLTGRRRPDPDGGSRIQLAVQVAGAAWVGKLPARVWIPGVGTSCQDGVVLDPGRLGEKRSQWVVQIRDTDAKLIDAWPVVGRQVGVPQDRQLPIADDVDGGNPYVVDVDALKARAGRR
jgi:hypothetical protein